MSTYRRRFVPLFIGVVFSLCLINAQSQTARTNPPEEARTNEFVHATLPAASSGLEGTEKEKVVTQFATVPAFFIENKGQTAKEVKYYFKGNDNVYFTDDGVMFQKIVKESGVKESAVGAGLPRPHRDGDGEAVEAKALAYKLEFIGAKPTSPQARSGLKGKVNYLIGNDRPKWRTNVPTYEEIVYSELYEGIEMVYKGVPGGMKYEFIVQPGANPDDIRLAYTGIEGLSIDDTGNLIIHTALGDVKDAKPYCYQVIDGKEAEVRCNFVIMEYSAHVAVDTHPQPLLLEGRTGLLPLFQEGRACLFPLYQQVGNPQAQFPLYQEETKGNGVLFPLYQEGIKGCVVNASMKNREKERFVYGFAVSSYNKAYPLIIDPGLEYSTFLGGSSGNGGRGIAVDSLGNAYVTGWAGGFGDFPTTAGAFDTSWNGLWDAFVTKLNATGTALEYSTFLGGSNHDEGFGIAVDGSGNAYVTGFTNSSNFPTTAGAFDTSHNGLHDVFVTKLNATGTALEYSTFLSGSDAHSFGIAVDGSGNAYVTGFAGFSDFPTTPGAFDTSWNGNFDAFVTKLNATGTALEYSTFLGGSNWLDWGSGIAVDSLGNAYVTGVTGSSDFPTTPGAFDTSWNAGNVFITKLNATGTALEYSTFLGEGTNDLSFGIAVDSLGNAYVTGGTLSSDFPTTSGAFDTSYNGNGDVFVTKLNATGTALDYSTFLGGSNYDEGNGIAVDGSGYACVTGFTWSSDFPTTPGAFDETPNGLLDVFVTRLTPSGTALEYSTFLGGSDGDAGQDIAVDGSGYAYVTGHTSSSGFPTTAGAFDMSFNGVGDTFVAKFSFNSPPEAEAEFIPIDVEEDEGHFEIAATAADPDSNLESIVSVIALPSLDGLDVELNVEDEVKIEFNLEEGKVEVKGPDPEALLAEIEENGGLLVENGQYVWIEITDEAKYELKYEEGVLHIEAPEVTLSVTATDTEGLTDTATASPVFPPEDE